jgi:hypothetical protein
MTASQIISEIALLPPEEQAEVIRFVYRLEVERRLTAAELTVLAERLTEATNPTERAVLREEMVRGFYGGRPHA